MDENGSHYEVIIVGGGLAGLSAAIYLGRAKRDVLLIDSGRSMAAWEPEVQNYLGFHEGISGKELLKRGRYQCEKYEVQFAEDEITHAEHGESLFHLRGKKQHYRSKCLLVATGIYHIPPDIEGVRECLGHSMFFCKDCDGYRVQGKRIAILGSNNETVEYALAMLLYSSCVVVATNGSSQKWDHQHELWLQEYEIPIKRERIVQVEHQNGQVRSLLFENKQRFLLDSLFTTRGDIYHNQLARALGAKTNSQGEIVVDENMMTTVPHLYAAGCVTPANCQMIIAAGEGATAAQAINRELFEESLKTHSLRRIRDVQIETKKTHPEVIKEGENTIS